MVQKRLNGASATAARGEPRFPSADHEVARPLLAYCQTDSDLALLRRLSSDPRLEVFATRQLTATWVAFSQRVAAGVLLVGSADPLTCLVYARTAGVLGHVMLSIDDRHDAERKQLEQLGDILCVRVPFAAASIERIVAGISERQSLATVEPSLHLLLDPVGRTARRGDTVVHLSQREYAVLHCLRQRGGEPVRTRDILQYVWDNSETLRSTKIVDVYVCTLRRKLRRIGLESAIRTVRGVGYALECNGAADAHPAVTSRRTR